VLIAGIVYSIVVLESVLAGFGLGLEGSGLFQVFLFYLAFTYYFNNITNVVRPKLAV